MGRKKCQAYKKQGCEREQKRAHHVLTDSGEGEALISINVKTSEINRVSFFKTIHSFSRGRDTVIRVHVMSLSMTHAKNTKYGDADKASEQNCRK